MRWIWIDKFTEFEPQHRAVAVKNVTRAEDHLHDQFPAYPILPTSLMIEGMAQTAGILVGQARQFAERVILAKIKQARISRPALPGDQVSYEAVIEHIDTSGATTAGTVAIDGQPCGTIDLVFSHLDRESGLALGIPEHNFVFSAEFRRILVASGLQHDGGSDS
jgi:3-hydroxyacyl-[acyl-carrier-protein] dehydratase